MKNNKRKRNRARRFRNLKSADGMLMIPLNTNQRAKNSLGTFVWQCQIVSATTTSSSGGTIFCSRWSDDRPINFGLKFPMERCRGTIVDLKIGILFSAMVPGQLQTLVPWQGWTSTNKRQKQIERGRKKTSSIETDKHSLKQIEKYTRQDWTNV